MQAFLKKHSDSHAEHGIKVAWTQGEGSLSIHFEVRKRTNKPWLADEAFTADWSKNWGLWNKDVVEAFLQLRTSPQDHQAPYLELQVSPLNQPFALIITEPRVAFQPPRVLHFKSESSIEGKLWKCDMEIKLPDELQGHLLYGSFFSCLGQEPREYYAMEPNPESTPDFHRPGLFLPLDT
jgi:hypothetical protein